MVKVFFALIFFILLSDCTNSQTSLPDLILEKVSQQLNSLKNVRYTHVRELNYSSENYHNLSEWSVYFDFQNAETLIGMKYQINDLTFKQIFNGTEKFELDGKKKTLQLDDHPSKESFSSLSAFYNSIVTLKNILPLLINDKTAAKMVSDTVINDKHYHLITCNIGKRRIQNLGNGYDAMRTKNDFIYKLLIEKNDYMPFEVLQVNNLNNDFIKTTFTNLEINTSSPSELSWYYPTYTDEYRPVNEKFNVKLLTIGSVAPDWTLSPYNKNKMVSLNELKGKVILLDFWIKNCGPCIQSVPHLNSLKAKFKSSNFEIISINSYDTKDEVNFFCKTHKTNYEVLLNGKDIAEKYGVNGFPAFFIIDKTGKIIYSHSGFGDSMHSDIEKVIENAL